VLQSEQTILTPCKDGPEEEWLYKKTSQYSKFEFSLPEIVSWAFVLVFSRVATQFLTAKHWLG
jgi:hypothetical protein